jgi:hypothetical protein
MISFASFIVVAHQTFPVPAATERIFQPMRAFGVDFRELPNLDFDKDIIWQIIPLTDQEFRFRHIHSR